MKVVRMIVIQQNSSLLKQIVYVFALSHDFLTLS